MFSVSEVSEWFPNYLPHRKPNEIKNKKLSDIRYRSETKNLKFCLVEKSFSNFDIYFLSFEFSKWFLNLYYIKNPNDIRNKKLFDCRYSSETKILF